MEQISRDNTYSLARSIAKRIVSRELSEYEGAMKIWKQIIDKLDSRCPNALWPVKSNASAIEDIKWNAAQGGASNDTLIQQCEQAIIAAARELIRSAIIQHFPSL